MSSASSEVIVNRKPNDMTLMLLGPGEFLNHRKIVKNELSAQGYTILIMEKIEDVKSDTGMDDKFQRLMKEPDASLFIAYFYKRTRMDTVLFEIGCICCKYGPDRVSKKLRLLGEKKFDWDKTTAYIKMLFPKAPRDEFDDSKRYSKASERIRFFVLDMS
ncbi:MAG: hypothetical protein M3044_05265 [Thermoproteota archaeon]|nr:hypothetical protein [Thermoproteota archaeon]